MFASFYCALVLLLCFAASCATPIGVTRGSTQDTYYALTANVLSAGSPSSWSTQVLDRLNLTEQYNEDRETALSEMRKRLRPSPTPDRLFALSELFFYHAESTGKTEHHLASAVYAYAFLFPEDGTPPPDPLDPRRRVAADLYNLGLVRGLRVPDGEEVLLQEGTMALPFGELEVSADQTSYSWGAFRFSRFIPVVIFKSVVSAIATARPASAHLWPQSWSHSVSGPQAELARKRIPPRLKVPVTAVIKIAEPRRAIVDGKLKGQLEIYAADRGSTVRLDGQDVPLELEPTAAFAYALEGAPVWDFEIAGFRFSDQAQIFGDGLIMMQPYRQGRIPVLRVHGTAASPVRWAEMYNEITHDPVLSGRYQFWLFQYNTGQPVLYSAMLLRRALRSVLGEVDPAGQDEALRRMVVIDIARAGC